MVNTITKQTINDGPRNLVVKYNLKSDGTEETVANVIDASSYDPAFVESSIMKLEYSMTGNFHGKLIWDATTNVDMIALSPDGHPKLNYWDIGGLPNNAGAGKTGDILLETVGIAANDELTIVLHIHKEGLPL